MSEPRTPTFINVELKGLYLSPSTFGNNVPAGALSVAENVVIDRPSVVEYRRGFSNAFSTLNNAGAKSLFQFANTKLMHGTDNKMYVDIADNGIWVDYPGTYAVPSPSLPQSRIRAVESNRNFYYITSNGTYKLDAPGNIPRLAGAPAGLSGFAVTNGSSGWFTNNTNVAYRVVFGYRDANGKLTLGFPSSRIIVSNISGGTRTASVTFQQPKEVVLNPTGFFYQLYRGNLSPNLITDPDDEMALVLEADCTGVSTVTVTDTRETNLRGAALYTNTGVTDGGILQGNSRPPWCTDVALFQQQTFYANTRLKHSGTITLIAAGASNGSTALVPGDTITFTASEFAGPTFTMTAVSGANNPALAQFNVSNTGVLATDIQLTASNIAFVANAMADNTFLNAYYDSIPGDLPGIVTFERTSFIENNFTITSSRNTCWQQPLPLKSNNSARQNRIYFSKDNDPEAVPIVNYVDVGSANQPINRIIPLRNGLVVLKQDGIFRISGFGPEFTVTAVDYTIRILADNTAAELENCVYFLSNQGVVAISESDSQIRSIILDKAIIENTSPTLFPNLQAVAWGISYQSDRKYILNMPVSSGDIQATQQYVYNYLYQNWVKWTIAASCGLVFIKDGKMYLGSVATAPGNNNAYIYQERKSFTISDYADNEYTTTNTTAGNTNVLVVANPALPLNVNLKKGWSVIQSSSGASARIVSTVVGPSFTTITLDRSQLWTTGPLVIYVPIYGKVKSIQLDCMNPGMNKQFAETIFIFNKQQFTDLLVTYNSNTSNIPVYDTILPARPGGWGLDPWSDTPWGGGTAGQGKVRRLVPQVLQRSGWIYIQVDAGECFTAFELAGIQLFYKLTSSREK